MSEQNAGRAGPPVVSSKDGARAAALGTAFGAASPVQARLDPNSVAAASPWKPVRQPEDD
jgi:hypothetical protein